MGQDERSILDVLNIRRAPVQNPIAERPSDEKQTGRRVLIVDHHENVLITIKRLLEEASYDTTAAQSGMKALQLLRQGAFDLVLLDDHLPDVSGEEIMREVRSAGAGTPVVVAQSGMRSDDLTVRYASRRVLLYQRAQSRSNLRTRARLPLTYSVSVHSFLKGRASRCINTP